MAKLVRNTVDLSGYPDLTVIYLGMRVNAFVGIKTLLGFGPRIAASVAAGPDGLLLHESFLFSLFPTGGTGFWHETYFMRGGMEAVYPGMTQPIGFLKFAPVVPARGSMFSARNRSRYSQAETSPIPVAENELYGKDGAS